MADLDQHLSYDELLQETARLRQQVAELTAHKTDLELIQEVTVEHADDVLADLHRKNQLIRKIFGRYLTDEVVTTLLEQPTALQIGGKRQPVSVLVADLRGFTAFSENLLAEDVIKILNCFLAQMTDIITQYDGTINDFTGDGIMVLFGAPTNRSDDAHRAVKCAIAMQLAMESVNQKIFDWSLPPLQMGIGINSGEAVVGNIGSEKHTKYSAIGKQVNLAYRIESYTVGGQVLISEQTLGQIQANVQISTTHRIHPKGLSQPITVFAVEGIGDDDALLLPQPELSLRPLPAAIPVKYAVLDGKQIGSSVFDGQLVKLSPKGAELQIHRLAPTSANNGLDDSKQNSMTTLLDLKLNVCLSPEIVSRLSSKTPSEDSQNDYPDEGSGPRYSNDIYAKILSLSEVDGTVLIHFTSLQPDDAAYLTQYYDSIKYAN